MFCAPATRVLHCEHPSPVLPFSVVFCSSVKWIAAWEGTCCFPTLQPDLANSWLMGVSAAWWWPHSTVGGRRLGIADRARLCSSRGSFPLYAEKINWQAWKPLCTRAVSKFFRPLFIHSWSLQTLSDLTYRISSGICVVVRGFFQFTNFAVVQRN